MKKVIPFYLSVLFLFACNDTDKVANNSPSDTAQETAATPATSGSSARAIIDVTIVGGEMAGTYSAVCKDACCSWGIAGENVFGNQYSETGKGPKELSSFQLIVDDVKEGNKTTNEFTATVSFGELFGENSKSFNINTRDGKSEGSGTVTIDYQGEKATVTLKGTSKEGAAIDLKMVCNKVITAQNFAQ